MLRYGNARDLVLGLEVALPDGRIWNGLNGLRKNNTGYDLKQLFLGSEGTLGIITAAVLKLFPKPQVVETALVAVPSVEAAVELFRRLNEVAGEALTAFELMARIAIDFCLAHIPGCDDPFGVRHPWYVLLTLASTRPKDPLRDMLEEALAEACEAGIVLDAVLAQNQSQTAKLWRLRESVSEAQKHEGGSIKNDIAVPLSRAAEFIKRASQPSKRRCPAYASCRSAISGTATSTSTYLSLSGWTHRPFWTLGIISSDWFATSPPISAAVSRPSTGSAS